jgi:hypothetical protein
MMCVAVRPTIAVQDHLSDILLRSIRPKRATTSLSASVDPTDARCTKVKGIV